MPQPLPYLFPLSASLLLAWVAGAHADAGLLRVSERQHGVRVTVFTAPTPLRVGAVDVSVLVQDAATGAVVDSSVIVRAWPRGREREAMRCAATPEAATNKLFRAAVFELPEPGWWDVEVRADGLQEPVTVLFGMEVAGPLPAWHSLAPWVGWPTLVVAGFVAHQCLVRRKRVRELQT